MKIKKLWIAAASFGLSASLLATVLTACSADDIEDDQKITLNDEGKLVGGDFFVGDKVIDYKTAITNALKRASSWATFKEALASELVYQWYEDRAAEKEDETGDTAKNVDFRLNLNKWKYDIDEAYDDTVQSCKDKYNQNYKFYLQNEYLSANGGTEESYKHFKLVDKVKEEFISKVWATNYFSWSSGFKEYEGPLPRYFIDDVSITVDEDLLNNPGTWDQLGFYAAANPEYAVETTPTQVSEVDTNFLARNPDGDYAEIQDTTFNRWFRTERPFFSAASLFKYSLPKYVIVGEDDKLGEVYNASSLGITLPDAPNEAYPFFGGVERSKEGVGTKAYWEWFHNLEKGKFFSPYSNTVSGTTTNYDSNGTITIPADNTEDSQTLLLSYGSQMIGGSSSLYVPYATAAANLYLDMVNLLPEAEKTRMNVITKAWMERGLKHWDPTAGTSGQWVPYTLSQCYHDKVTAILNNFFFPADSVENAEVTLEPKQLKIVDSNPISEEDFGATELNSYLDLKAIYGGSEDETGYFHSDLFKPPFYDNEFDFFYGRTDNKDGVRYIINTAWVELDAKKNSWTEKQPWILELNEAGMHAQTIDGYAYVKSPSTYVGSPVDITTEQALKNVVKYRLMQKKCGYKEGQISADVFGDSGALKSYFTNNFADIILEIALRDDDTNIFRKNENYNKAIDPQVQEETLFEKLIADEGFGFDEIKAYIQATAEYDEQKKYVDECIKANDTIYAYRKDQITNSKFDTLVGDIYKNGLLAPLAYDSFTLDNSETIDSGRTHEYRINKITYFEWGVNGKAKATIGDSYSSKIVSETTTVNTAVNAFNINQVACDGTSPFSPLVKDAKKVSSNRYWFKSKIVDKMMYQCMGSADLLANQIKSMAYDEYVSKNEEKQSFNAKLNNDYFKRALASTFRANQLFNADKNFASYFSKDTTNYFASIDTAYTAKEKIALGIDGAYNSIDTSYKLFKATLMYLMMDTAEGEGATPQPFGNFYKILNSKIGEDESAIIGYVNKVNTTVEKEEEYSAPTITITSDVAQTYAYDWKANVENMFDQLGYATGSPVGSDVGIANSKVACDQYWNVVNKIFNVAGTAISPKMFAGFTGLQTESSNTLDASIKDAAFDQIAKHSSGSINLNENINPNIKQATRYEPHYGAWFAYAGSKDTKGNLITFDKVEWKDPTTQEVHTIQASDFGVVKSGDEVLYDTTVCLRLAKKMANYSSIQDLKTLAKNIGDAYNGGSIYRQIGSGELTFTDINKMKYYMLEALPRVKDNVLVDTHEYLKCFQRLENVEIHAEEDQDLGQGLSYAFKDKNGSAYKLMLTQINKADITEKTFAPKWEQPQGQTGHWEQGTCPITMDEFFYILCSTAWETSVQSLAITQVVRNVFGDAKLEVYDANLYNAFDSIWIKDWVKKPIGA